MVATNKIRKSSDEDQTLPDIQPGASGNADGHADSLPPQQVVGRAVFAVDTSAAGIMVRTAFLSEQGQLIEMPAVFPDLGYALDQIEHLRRLVIERFAQAAQVGAQVIAASQSPAATASGAGDAPPTEPASGPNAAPSAG